MQGVLTLSFFSALVLVIVCCSGKFCYHDRYVMIILVARAIMVLCFITLNPKPYTLNQKTWILNPNPWLRCEPQPSTTPRAMKKHTNLRPWALNPRHGSGFRVLRLKVQAFKVEGVCSFRVQELFRSRSQDMASFCGLVLKVFNPNP